MFAPSPQSRLPRPAPRPGRNDLESNRPPPTKARPARGSTPPRRAPLTSPGSLGIHALTTGCGTRVHQVRRNIRHGGGLTSALPVSGTPRLKARKGNVFGGIDGRTQRQSFITSLRCRAWRAPIDEGLGSPATTSVLIPTVRPVPALSRVLCPSLPGSVRPRRPAGAVTKAASAPKVPAKMPPPEKATVRFDLAACPANFRRRYRREFVLWRLNCS